MTINNNELETIFEHVNNNKLVKPENQKIITLNTKTLKAIKGGKFSTFFRKVKYYRISNSNNDKHYCSIEQEIAVEDIFSCDSKITLLVEGRIFCEVGNEEKMAEKLAAYEYPLEMIKRAIAQKVKSNISNGKKNLLLDDFNSFVDFIQSELTEELKIVFHLTSSFNISLKNVESLKAINLEGLAADILLRGHHSHVQVKMSGELRPDKHKIVRALLLNDERKLQELLTVVIQDMKHEDLKPSQFTAPKELELKIKTNISAELIKNGWILVNDYFDYECSWADLGKNLRLTKEFKHKAPKIQQVVPIKCDVILKLDNIDDYLSSVTYQKYGKDGMARFLEDELKLTVDNELFHLKYSELIADFPQISEHIEQDLDDKFSAIGWKAEKVIATSDSGYEGDFEIEIHEKNYVTKVHGVGVKLDAYFNLCINNMNEIKDKIDKNEDVHKEIENCLDSILRAELHTLNPDDIIKFFIIADKKFASKENGLKQNVEQWLVSKIRTELSEKFGVNINQASIKRHRAELDDKLDSLVSEVKPICIKVNSTGGQTAIAFNGLLVVTGVSPGGWQLFKTVTVSLDILAQNLIDIADGVLQGIGASLMTGDINELEHVESVLNHYFQNHAMNTYGLFVHVKLTKRQLTDYEITESKILTNAIAGKADSSDRLLDITKENVISIKTQITNINSRLEDPSIDEEERAELINERDLLSKELQDVVGKPLNRLDEQITRLNRDGASLQEALKIPINEQTPSPKDIGNIK